MQAYNGVINNVAETEEEAFSIIRRFLSYLPDNVWVRNRHGVIEGDNIQ